MRSAAVSTMPGARFALAGVEDGYGAALKEDARRYYGAQVSFTRARRDDPQRQFLLRDSIPT